MLIRPFQTVNKACRAFSGGEMLRTTIGENPVPFKRPSYSETLNSRIGGPHDEGGGPGGPGTGFCNPGGGCLSSNSSSGLPLLLLPLQPPPGLQKPVPGPPGPPRYSLLAPLVRLLTVLEYSSYSYLIYSCYGAYPVSFENL